MKGEMKYRMQWRDSPLFVFARILLFSILYIYSISTLLYHSLDILWIFIPWIFILQNTDIHDLCCTSPTLPAPGDAASLLILPNSSEILDFFFIPLIMSKTVIQSQQHKVSIASVSVLISCFSCSFVMRGECMLPRLCSSVNGWTWVYWWWIIISHRCLNLWCNWCDYATMRWTMRSCHSTMRSTMRSLIENMSTWPIRASFHLNITSLYPNFS